MNHSWQIQLQTKVTPNSTPGAARVLVLERKMDEQEEAEEAENKWHAKMDGLTRKSCFNRCQV